MSGAMNSCPMEREVLRAATIGAWPAAVRAHVVACEECAAAAEVAGWMQDLASQDLRDHPLPDPSVLWLKANVLKSSTVLDRASRPILNLQIAAYLLLGAAWAVLVTTKWASVRDWLHSLTPGEVLVKAAGAGTSVSLSLSIVLAFIVLASLTVTLALHTILAEE